ncbi:cytochrome P450 [Natrononativus amylolyticus]|uniref:cytochrome P450 n=1 Tax=Natrononativus amylolyticus TaxID=2963434 RepID=UPI0020CE04EA|nr:cytochrome P450 [Natrononativus amylolyticus]
MDSQIRHPPIPSGHPLIGHALDFARSPFDFIDRATSECGDLYLMELPGTDVYVLAHPEYFKQVLVTEVDSFGKTADFQRVFGNGLLSTEGRQWSYQRKILQPLFHRQRIGGYGNQMVAATQRRLDTWTPGKIHDIESEMHHLTLEILFSTLLGRELPPEEGDDLRAASDGLNKWFVPTSWLLPSWVPTPSRREFTNSQGVLRKEIRRLLADHSGSLEDQQSPFSSEPQQDTLLSKLHQASEESDQGTLSKTEIEDQLLTMIFAGYETTASALGFAWYSLATNPEIKHAFHEELDTVLDGDLPTQEDIPDLEITNQIVTETIRMYPPIHTIPRETTRDVEIGEYRIPAGEEVHLSVMAVHRDERYYDDPLSFRPSRWTAEFEDDLPNHAFIPFGGGRRTCIGREFARLEAALVLATIGQQWTLEWAGEETTLTVEPEITTRPKNGLPMQITRRETS